MSKNFLEIKLEGWTATPRMPFVLSGNALCMPVPSYSMLLGLLGCCLGRTVSHKEVQIGFYYEFDEVMTDMETRHRLVFKNRKVKAHGKGTDAYEREVHINPKLTLWIDRTDWKEAIQYPEGTPALGQSQDLMRILSVKEVQAEAVEKASVKGCMLPFDPTLKIGGQLVQLAEAYEESEQIGEGRKATNSRIFMAVSHEYDSEKEIKLNSLYRLTDKETEQTQSFYLHQWN